MASAPKTGPLAGRSAVTYWPAIQLWVHDVNERGGIDVGGTKMKVELIAPIAMEEGLRFAIREGGRTVGAGVVAGIQK